MNTSMNVRVLEIFASFMKRMIKPCSCCKTDMLLRDIHIHGLGDTMDGTGNPMLYFTHIPCGSTMVSRGPAVSAALEPAVVYTCKG